MAVQYDQVDTVPNNPTKFEQFRPAVSEELRQQSQCARRTDGRRPLLCSCVALWRGDKNEGHIDLFMP